VINVPINARWIAKKHSANLWSISPEGTEIIQELTENEARKVKSVRQKRPENESQNVGKITLANNRCKVEKLRLELEIHDVPEVLTVPRYLCLL
jgi:hypothetical protein